MNARSAGRQRNNILATKTISNGWNTRATFHPIKQMAFMSYKTTYAMHRMD
jgi:hypothetical protein